MKTIALLIPQLRHGGAERVVSNLSFLLKTHYNVKIVVFDDRNMTYDAGSEVVSLNIPPVASYNVLQKGRNLIRRIRRYKNIKKELNIAITYSFGEAANFVNVFSGGHDKKITSIRGFRRLNLGRNFLEKKIMKLIAAFIYHLSDEIVSVSNLISETLTFGNDLEASKVHTIYNGYDIKKIQSFAEEEIENAEKHIFDSDVIITAGSLRYEKGYWHLIKAFKQVLKHNGDLKLVILGEGDKVYKDKITKLISELDLEGNVYLLGYKENPYKYFERSKVYVLSSVFEGFPNSLLEAMACGIPIVATDCQSGPKEILSPSNDSLGFQNGLELVEYGILSKRMNTKENFDALLIEDEDIILSEAILLGIEKETYYQKKSLERVMDFSYEVWLKKHIELFSLKN